MSLVLENMVIYLGIKSHTKVTYAPGIQDTNEIVYVYYVYLYTHTHIIYYAYYNIDPYQEGQEKWSQQGKMWASIPWTTLDPFCQFKVIS